MADTNSTAFNGPHTTKPPLVRRRSVSEKRKMAKSSDLNSGHGDRSASTAGASMATGLDSGQEAQVLARDREVEPDMPPAPRLSRTPLPRPGRAMLTPQARAMLGLGDVGQRGVAGAGRGVPGDRMSPRYLKEYARRKARRMVLGDESKSLRGALKEELSKPPRVLLRHKLSFFLGVLNMCVTQWVLLGHPTWFRYWYTGWAVPLLIYRYHSYTSKKWGLFMLDFCYFANVSCGR